MPDTDFPSDLGHWERIAEGANAMQPERTIDLHILRQDICRALCDLNLAAKQRDALVEAARKYREAENDFMGSDNLGLYLSAEQARDHLTAAALAMED